jgi:hypothetical protein
MGGPGHATAKYSPPVLATFPFVTTALPEVGVNVHVNIVVKILQCFEISHGGNGNGKRGETRENPSVF